jgi:dolichol-phosphate mannosyltransferase
MKILAVAFAYNEGEKIQRVVARHRKDRPYDLMVMDDGSTDGSIEKLSEPGLLILRNPTNRGIGFAMKRVFEYALEHGYDILVIQAGNDKDNPLEVHRLIAPIIFNEADYVQGSRFLRGGAYGNMPLYRYLATRYVHPFLFWLAAGKSMTETSNGFRAIRVSILRDPRIDWRQSWLDHYELEIYLLCKVIKLGYRHVEAPVTKIYPPHQEGYTKVKPISGWWSILRPLFYLGLGLRK